MDIDPILVTRSSMPPFEEYVSEIAPLWESRWLTNMGVKHQELERRLEEYLGVADLALFVNGHQALECVLEAMGLSGKVITTPYSFASTTHAIVRKGLKPVFADIRPDDYTLDPAEVERLVDGETCAILPVHVYGNPCDDDALADIAERHGLRLIYDAAHAFGVRVNGRPVASFGDASMFSFHATKVFNTIEGGAVCFKDPQLKTKLNRWKNFGIADEENVEFVGGNAKMNEFCAAMGLCNLRHLPGEIEKRRLVAQRYWERLEAVDGIRVHRPASGVSSNYAYLPAVFEEGRFGATRDDVFAALRRQGVFSRKYFYPLISDFACYQGRFDSDLTPHAQHVAARVLTLPLYADLALEDVDRICDVIVACGR
ncbi:DegT/DnrJ/EryC1/StrS aminotransferase family protein [Olsenella sp. HMSC062G07]|uniref:DegT/DnrJ/EryC1/StrS family aminotransferase n=1 Tax=Olsenella sp. HMSC062G07 TaxID=1739330 RepID=UPI0008A62597|nr:DegT/DnrJ/EryC1/StrS family aminotransferase [Olsenella sp. HMSC062G07]OFK24125.1 aminotransferase [Olsenella sp. HMSC062G07]